MSDAIVRKQQHHARHPQQQQDHVRRYFHPAQTFNKAGVWKMERWEGQGVDNSLDIGHINNVDVDKEPSVLTSISSLSQHPQEPEHSSN